MAKANLTLNEKTALLVVIKKELEVIFEDLELKVKGAEQTKSEILEKLTFLIQKGLKTNPEKVDIYELFD